MLAVSSTRINYGLFSSSSFPSFLLPEQLVQNPLDGAEQVRCVCVCVGDLGGWWAVVAQRRSLVSAWQEKGIHTGPSLARGSLAWEGWGGHLCGWAAWVRSWRLKGRGEAPCGSVTPCGVSWPKWGGCLFLTGVLLSERQWSLSRVRKTSTLGIGGRCWYGVGAPVGWGGCPDRSRGGGMKCQGLSWVNRASMW